MNPAQPTLETILAAARAGEGVDWEFKSARGGVPGSLWETYSAMANTDGGVIVLGASERDLEIRLDGLPATQAERYRRDLWATLNNRGKVSLNLLRDGDIEILPYCNATLLVLRIRQATRSERPVYLNAQPVGNTWRRNHDGDFHCTEAEVRRMFADAQETRPDHRILPGFTLADLDSASLSQYRQRFRAAKGEHPWLGLEDRELLEKIQSWRRDRVSGEEGPTLAGVLMFGRTEAIRDPSAAPEFFPDYREKLDPALRWTNRLYPDGSWEANLFQFYQRVSPELAAGLPTPFHLEAGMRRDDTPAHEALREAFVNALIHADHTAPGGIVIERHSDRFILSNPGVLLVSMEQFRRGGVSECRNPALQQMFLMIGGGERAGSGVDKIRSGWLSRHWRPPLLRTQSRPDRVELVLPMVSLIPDATIAALQVRFGKEFVTALPAEALQALATIEIEGTTTNSRLQELLDRHPSDITRLLQDLCNKRLIDSDNRRRWATYRFSESPRSPELFDALKTPKDSSHKTGDSSHKTGDSSHKTGDSSHKTGDSSHKTGDSSHKTGDSSHKTGDSSHKRGHSAGVTRIEMSESAKKVAMSQRSTPDRIESAIFELCRGRFLTVQDLAALLNRYPPSLRQRHITPMVAAGKLRLRFPRQGNRPDQAYTSAENPPESGTS
jgi:ATP-dependent DNA helicase RecG